MRVSLRAGRLALLMVLPFFLLVRGAVAAHAWLGLPAWLALVLGAGLATLAAAAVGARLWHRLTGQDRFRAIARNVALPLVAVFCVYGLGWLASSNAKSPEIRALWRELHPSLRLAVATAILADREVVVTDIARSREDYDRMGLARVERSLHLEQPDGFVHAVDLRTRGRGTLRNGLAWLYFRSMGFRALRHGGTGDHLHVSLPRP